MNKELVELIPSSVTQSQDLEVARRTNFAQRAFDDGVELAEVLKQRVSITVNNKGEARYDFKPEETKVNPSNEVPIITIFKASTEPPLSAERTNGQEKPNKEREVNEALKEKNKRRQHNRAIFSGLDGKTVYQNGRAVNVKDVPVNPENGTNNKRKNRGRRNGSR